MEGSINFHIYVNNIAPKYNKIASTFMMCFEGWAQQPTY
jgi:hypothetical protein